MKFTTIAGSIVFLGLMCSFGCQQSTPVETTSEASRHSSVEMIDTGTSGTLTLDEIHAFLAVLNRLPNHQVPSCTETVLPRLTSTERLDVAVVRLRQSIRDAVTAERQAKEWERDPQLQAAFAEIHVSPVAFARLMLKISCAWSAWKVREATSLTQATAQLNCRMGQLVNQLENSKLLPGSQEQTELLQSLEEQIGMAEFLDLLMQVPVEDIRAVASAQAELKRVLPESSLAQEVASLVDAQSAILRTSYPARQSK